MDILGAINFRGRQSNLEYFFAFVRIFVRKDNIFSIGLKKYTTYNYDISQFLANYEKLLNQNNLTHYKFMKTIGYDESIIRHWKSGSITRLDIIYYIAKNLGGSMDNLIGRK